MKIMAVSAEQNVIFLEDGPVRKEDVERYMKNGLSYFDAIIVVYQERIWFPQVESPKAVPIPMPVLVIEPIDDDAWTENEKFTLLKKLAVGNIAIGSLVRTFNRTEQDISSMAKELGAIIHPTQDYCIIEWRKFKYWLDTEVELLIEYKGRLTHKEIATLLGRTEYAVTNKWHDINS